MEGGVAIGERERKGGELVGCLVLVSSDWQWWFEAVERAVEVVMQGVWFGARLQRGKEASKGGPGRGPACSQ